MNTMQAFAMGQANRNKPMRVFDWDKAARIIKERGCAEASAGLEEDWGYTSGLILEDSKPANEYTYLASTWATPVLSIGGETIPCHMMESETENTSDTKWPESALAILNS